MSKQTGKFPSDLAEGCTDAEINGPQEEQQIDSDFFEREYLPGFDEI